MNKNDLHIDEEQKAAMIATLNGPIITNALYGDTFAYAMLNTALGGHNMVAKNTGQIASVLRHARPGDILKFDRKNKLGHQTVFKSFENGEVCFWSSNQVNRNGSSGVGINCERIDTLDNVVISRFPTDLQSLPSRLEKIKSNSGMARFFKTANVHIEIDDVQTSASLECPSPQGQQLKPATTSQ